MTVGLVDLGTVTDLVPSAYSGFVYPNRKSKLALLENDADTAGNLVVQEGSLPYREATLSVLVETADDKDTIRDYESAGDTVAFVDDAGALRSVLLLACTTSQGAGNLWEVTVTLLEISEPAGGS